MPAQTPPGEAGPDDADSRPTAERILDAAEDVFAHRGYDGTTLREVADRVGIRIPSLYNHFDGKLALYLAVLERGMRPILDMLARAIRQGEEARSEPQVVVAEVMDLLGARPNLPRLVQYEMLAGGEHLALMLDSFLRPTLERSLEVLHGTPAALNWKPEQLPYLLLALLNMILGHFAMTPLIEQLLGDSAHSPEVVTRATELYGQVAALLILGGATSPSPQPSPRPRPASGARSTASGSTARSGPASPFPSAPTSSTPRT